MPHALKKFVLLGALLALLPLWLWAPRGAAPALVLVLVVWLLVETRLRARFRFSAGPVRERGLTLPDEAEDLRCHGLALFVHPGGGLSLANPGQTRAQSVALEGKALALLPLGHGRFLAAFEDRLSLRDSRGKEVRSLAFDPPLLRQSYRLLPGPDGARGLLLTPWFAQVFELSLERLAGRVRYEDAGHYFKDGALAATGRGLLLAGTSQLPEEEGGGLEARWDWWTEADGVWTRAWSQVREGYDNSHVRGVQAGGAVLCAEWWRGGYGFELRDLGGALLWERPGGERPVLSPDGGFVAWEPAPDILVLSGTRGTERWRWKCAEQVRLKRVLDDGSCAALEGRCLRRFSPTGKQSPEIWLRHDAHHAAFDSAGRLVLAEGKRAAFLDPGR